MTSYVRKFYTLCLESWLYVLFACDILCIQDYGL